MKLRYHTPLLCIIAPFVFEPTLAQSEPVSVERELPVL